MLRLTGCAPAPATVEPAPPPSETGVPGTATLTTQQAETPIPTPTLTPEPKAVIKIVSQSPLSGNQAIFGKDIQRGAELAVRQLTGPLAEQGYEVVLLPYDDRNNLETAQANAAEVVADLEVLCAIGHYAPRVTVQASEIYHDAGLAFVAPVTTNSALTDRGYLEVNRVIGRNDRQGVAAAQFAKDQGLASFYIITQKDEYGLKNAEYFRIEGDRMGIQGLGMLIIDVTGDLDAAVTQMMAADPELVYFAGTADQAIPFFQKARAAGYAGTFLGLDDLNNPSLFELADPSLIEGGMYYTIMSAPANLYPGAAKFIEDFNVHYGSNPLLFAARAYDATGICIKAIEEAIQANGGAIPTRGQVASAIRALKDYKGITGTYNFNGQGDLTLAKYYVYKVVSVDAANWDQNFIIASYDVAPP
jgi:branched-chain amino acid transport system substrate-binding protein